MYTQPLAEYMAKLYWRIKKDDKWTWRPAEYEQAKCGQCECPFMRVALYQEEEK